MRLDALRFRTVDFKYIRIRERHCYRPTFNNLINRAANYGDCGRWCIENRKCGAFTTEGNGKRCSFKRGSCDRFLRHNRHVSTYIPKGNNINNTMKFNTVFHKLDEIGNNANIRIRGLNTWKHNNPVAYQLAQKGEGWTGPQFIPYWGSHFVTWIFFCSRSKASDANVVCLWKTQILET